MNRWLLLLMAAVSVLLSKPTGYARLEREEGKVLHVYPDSVGYHTIGYGHLLTPKEKATGKIVIGPLAVSYKGGITEAQAAALLTQDVGFAERAVTALVTRPLQQNQFDALVSFTFNVGKPHLAESRVLRYVNAGMDSLVPDAMARWVFAGGIKQAGLVARRQREGALWRGL